jgi:hypothetical protein
MSSERGTHRTYRNIRMNSIFVVKKINERFGCKMNGLNVNRLRIFVICAIFLFTSVETRGQSDSFDGTVIDETKWEVAMSDGSTVIQNEALFITCGNSPDPEFPNTPGLFGPGSGIGSRCKLSGDFDIQVDFFGYTPVPELNWSQLFFNVYQDPTTQLHIKRITGTTVNGIQTIYTTTGSNRFGSGVTQFSGSAGTFRIVRTGSAVKTYYNIGSGFVQHYSIPSGYFTGDVVVTINLSADSVVIDNFIINSGTIVCPGSTDPEATITSPSSGFLASVGTTVQFEGLIDDPDVGDSHTAEWTISSDSGIEYHEGTVTDGSVNDSFQFSQAGIYSISLTVTDAAGESDTATTVNGMPAFIVVYDPSAGFVTGGGWIYSEAGAYLPNPMLEGRANFGFVSKYTKGSETPTGNTECVFQAADLNFHSNSYDWLVVNQAGSNAQFKGFRHDKQ